MQLLEPPVDALLLGQVRAVLPGGTRDGDLDVDVRVLAQELVERRVDEADDDRQAVHGLEHLAEIALLERQQLRERALPAFGAVRHDHVLHDRQALGLPEHVLGPREPHPLRTELPRELAFAGCVGVHPHPEATALVGPREELDERLLLAEVGLDRG